jgi:hypothetical protein
MPQQSNGKLMTVFQQIFAVFCVLMTEACCHFAPPTEICISLFFHFSASKLRPSLITTACLAPLCTWRRRAVTSRRREGVGGEVTNRNSTNFDSNVAIRTFELLPASKNSRQKTNLLKQSAFICVLCVSVVKLLLCFAEMLMAEMLTCSLQTDSKGYFCLVTAYGHKNLRQPQNTRTKKLTSPNNLLPSLRAADTTCILDYSKRAFLSKLPNTPYFVKKA